MNRMAIALFRSRGEAERIRDRLTPAGLNPQTAHPALGRMWFVFSRDEGWSLEVPADQFERAAQLLLDWEEKEGPLTGAIHCPECGSLRVEYPQYTRRTLLTNLAMGIAAQLGVIEKDFFCQDCQFTWPKTGARARRDRPHMAPYYFIDGIEQKLPTGPEGTSSFTGERRKAA